MALCILALVLFAGCSSERQALTTAPVEAPAGDEGPTFVGFTRTVSPAALSVRQDTEFIRAFAGGELAVGGVRVRIPGGALPQDMTLTLRLAEGGDVRLSIEPEGVNFRWPITIQLDEPRQTDARRFSLVRFYEETGGGASARQTWSSHDRVRGAVQSTGTYSLRGSEQLGSDPVLVRFLTGSDYRTELIRSHRGGVIEIDRVRLTVPPGALERDTYITVRQIGDGVLEAELEPHGLQFKAPVRLEFNLDGLSYDPALDWGVYWLNETSGVWVDQGGTLNGVVVGGDLWHFSIYGPGGRGRAGW